MKKIIVIFIMLFLFVNLVNAQNIISSQISSTNYNFDNYEFNQNNQEFTISENADKIAIKKYSKIKKMYKNKKYSEILKIQDDFLPALYMMYLNYYNNKQYNDALIYLYKIRQKHPFFNPKYINKNIIICLYNSKQYEKVISEAKEFGYNKTTYYIVADSYFNISDYVNAYNIASKVTVDDDNYIKAQEIVFKCLYRQNKLKEATAVAIKLVNIDSLNPNQFIRLAACSTNVDEKLTNLYRARNLMDINPDKIAVNSIILSLEQSKIDNIVKKSSKYIELPNWIEIVQSFLQYGSDEYWMKRQDMFFSSIDKCKNLYKDKELSECFTSVINKQNILNQQLLQEKRMAQEDIYRRSIIEQNERMINLKQLQIYNQMQINDNLHNINNNMIRQNTNLQNINNNLQWHNNNLQRINNSFIYHNF